MTDFSRRDFLKIITNSLLSASGLLGLGGLLHYLNFSSEADAKTEFVLGSVADFPQGSRTVLPEVPALLIHNDDGFSALNLICPHLGCTVKYANDNFICPCHGSQFDAKGDVNRGPAQQALRSLRVEIDENNILHLYTI